MKERSRPDRGFVNAASLPRGPSGLPCCRYCGTECAPPRRTFCSDGCIDEWKIRTQPGYAAKQVLARDCGVCAACGLDCIILLQELRKLRADERNARYGGGPRVHLACTAPGDLTMLIVFVKRLDELGLRGSYRGLVRRLWEMDHVVPVSEGGGACGLDNLRTLCWRCHGKETAALAGRRALSKRNS